MNEPIPVTIRGVIYPSIHRAAKELGLNPASISRAMDEGRLDKINIGRRHNAVRVMCDNMTFDTQRELAKHYEASEALINRRSYYARKRGKTSFTMPFGEVFFI